MRTLYNFAQYEDLYSGVTARLTEGTKPIEPIDVVVRVANEQAGGTLTFSEPMPTHFVYNTFRAVAENHLQYAQRDLDLLKGVVKWQHRLIDYNSYYSAFLLEQLTEAEFETIAGDFIYDEKEGDASEVANAVARLLRLTGIKYTPSEMAELFQCKHQTVINAYQQLSLEMPELTQMLPEVASRLEHRLDAVE